MRGEHVLTVAGTVDPSLHGTLHRVNLAVIIRDILGERSLEEGHFVVSPFEAVMADWAFALSHVDAVLHRNVVQGLVPSEGWQLVSFSELVSEIEGPNAPLLRLAFPS